MTTTLAPMISGFLDYVRIRRSVRAVFDAVDLSYRYRMVWGSVAGIVISDADGTALTAMAVRATEYGESLNCATSDTTGYLSWMVVR